MRHFFFFVVVGLVTTDPRKPVHKVCAEVEETIKYGFIAFDYKGPFCTMASFKAHCAFGFWKNKLIANPEGKSRNWTYQR